MIASPLRKVLTAAGLLALVIVVVLPAVALLTRVLAAWQPPVDGFAFSARQAVLMLKTVGLAAAGVAGACLLSLPGAFCIGRIAKPANAPLLVLTLILPLMLPPMIYAFGWQRLWPAYSPGFSGTLPLLRCVWIWSSWAWPIPAVIIGSGWSRIGRDAYESALLDASARSAFLRAALPALSRHVLVAALILFVLFLGEYSVPHANGLMVIATELLWVAQNFGAVDVLWLSVPLIVAILVAFRIVRTVWPGPMIETATGRHLQSTGTQTLHVLLALLIVAVTAAVPIISISWRDSLADELRLALATYHFELLVTLCICVAVGLLVTLIGIAATAVPRLHSAVIITTLVIGLLPGALVGEAVLAAYQPTGWLYEIPAFETIGRWIGVLAAWLASRTIARQLLWQSAVDGADASTARLTLTLSYQWPTLLAGMFLAAAMAMADVATTEMVAVPTAPMIARILIEKFHRFETGMLVSLSLWLVASAVPGAILVFVALKRRR